jgi:hypothetical protein
MMLSAAASSGICITVMCDFLIVIPAQVGIQFK